MGFSSDRLTRRRGRGSAVALALFVVGVLVLAGCSSPATSATGSATGSAAGSAAGSSAAGSSAAGSTVTVTLTEWAVVMDNASVPAGNVTFDVTNAGTQFAHEFVVINTDLALTDLPADATGKVDEAGAGITFVGEVAELAIGATGSVSLDLAPGKYVMVCNIVEAAGGHESHYLQGMRTAFTVT